MAVDHVFAGPGKVFIRAAAEAKAERLKQVIWGDWLRVLSRAREAAGWLQVRGRGADGWVLTDEVQADRLLEVNFVDVGQGDGAFIVTPDDEFGLVDAGAGTNMRRFLSWRFNLQLDREKKEGQPHETGRVVSMRFAVISHSDLDHYEGFRGLFTSTAFKFKAVYHNCLVERPAEKTADKLGERGKVGGRSCVTGLVESHESLTALLAESDPAGKTKYLSLLRAAHDSQRVDRIEGLTADAKFLPGFKKGNKAGNGTPFHIEVLGPIPLVDQDTRGLPWFTDNGKTKNGHSVVLRVNYGDVRILLGGDLNVPAEEHLLAQSVGDAPADEADEAAWEAWLGAARKAFGADIAKSCHHGSGDFSTLFLRAIHPAATVISSGDDEPHCHPRPNTLGAIGRHSRGERPLIFSTELSRSTNEFTKPSLTTQEEIRAIFAELGQADEDGQAAHRKKLDQLLDKAERNVAVYGLITLRTDGKRALIAQKLERLRPGTGEGYDLQWLEPDENGVLAPVEG